MYRNTPVSERYAQQHLTPVQSWSETDCLLNGCRLVNKPPSCIGFVENIYCGLKSGVFVCKQKVVEPLSLSTQCHTHRVQRVGVWLGYVLYVLAWLNSLVAQKR